MTHRKGSRLHREGKHWNTQELQRLKKMANGNTPTDLIADAIGRTKTAIYSMASQKNISLRPTNKSPHNKRRK